MWDQQKAATLQTCEITEFILWWKTYLLFSFTQLMMKGVDPQMHFHNSNWCKSDIKVCTSPPASLTFICVCVDIKLLKGQQRGPVSFNPLMWVCSVSAALLHQERKMDRLLVRVFCHKLRSSSSLEHSRTTKSAFFLSVTGFGWLHRF